MEKELTKKYLKYWYRNILYTEYCNMYWILDENMKIGYNAGIYGWNWSAYEINRNTVIITGYRNFTGRQLPWQMVKKYNHLGKMAHQKGKYSLCEKLLKRLIRQAKK